MTDGARIRVWLGSIVDIEVDAIVNAANTSLLGGGGVDGVIHRAAGPGLLAECTELGGCKVGQAKATGGHNLSARWVIHTVGPIWRGGREGEDKYLASCYRTSLECADKLGARTIAFPAISTGAYGFPKERAAKIAASTLSEAAKTLDSICEIVLAVMDTGHQNLLTRALREVDL